MVIRVAKRGLLRKVITNHLPPQARDLLRLCKRLLRTAGGRARIPASLRTL